MRHHWFKESLIYFLVEFVEMKSVGNAQSLIEHKKQECAIYVGLR